MSVTPSQAPEPVLPALEGDAIVVRLGVGSPFGSADLEFSGGGVLRFDPAAPDRLFEVRTENPEDGEGTLTVALGAEAAEQLAGFWKEGVLAGPIHPHPADELAPLARLALVSWLEQWTPLDIPGQALLLDVATQAHAAAHPLLAIRSFSSSADYLVAIAREALAAGLPVPITEGIHQALVAAVASFKGGHQLSPALADLADEYASLQIADVSWDARLDALLDEELVAIHGVDPDLGALFSVDWALVPSRVLHAGEGQGHMTVGTDGVRITVTPAHWIDASSTMGLQARLLDAGSGRPLADAPLLWDSAARVFAADFTFDRWADVSAEDLANALPEVYSQELDGSRPDPRVGAARDAASAWRESVRALTQLRRSNAAELALGARVREFDRAAGLGAQAAALKVEHLGERFSAKADSLRAWRSLLMGGEAAGPWPSGLLVPASFAVGRPTLAELVDVTAPEMFTVAAT